MATDAGWGRRLRAARRAFEERHDRSLTYREIGELVGDRLSRGPFAHPTVRAWFVDGQEPESFAIAIAIAEILETEAGPLITGAGAVAVPADAAPAQVIAKPEPEEGGRAWVARMAKEKAAKKGGQKKRKG